MQITQIRPADFAHWVSTQAQTPVVLDVRETWELELARVSPQGTKFLHIPMGTIPGSLSQIPNESPVAVLCHHGVRSMRVAQFLASQGYTQIYNIAGGIDAWAAQVDKSVGVY